MTRTGNSDKQSRESEDTNSSLILIDLISLNLRQLLSSIRAAIQVSLKLSTN